MAASDKDLVRVLIRLSFWVPSDRMKEFEVAYDKQVAPILRHCGLGKPFACERTSPDTIFSRVFEMTSLSEMENILERNRGNLVWEKTLKKLGATFGSTDYSGMIQHSIQVLSAPASYGRVAPIGPGETIYPGGKDGHWHIYDTTDGLAGGEVTSILQDTQGNLWFGTDGGVCQYDGRVLTTYTARHGLVNNQVLSILQDRDGHLWFATNNGVSRYDGRSFISFTIQDGLPSNSVRSILQDTQGNLWFGTDEGVSRYDGLVLTTYTARHGLVNNQVLSILQDRDGHLWFATNNGVSRYDGRSFISFTIQDGLPGNSVRSILQDTQGNLWFGTGGGVSRYDGQMFINFTTKDGLADNRVMSIFQDGEGHLWFGTNNGVTQYDGRSFASFFGQHGLAQKSVISILQDREGHLWFGTNGGGVSRYDAQSFSSFTTLDGLPHYAITKILEDRRRRLWFGTDGGGVSRLDGQSFTSFTTAHGLAHNHITSIFQGRDGHLWFGTHGGGASKYDGQSFTSFTTAHGLAHNHITSIFQDRDGHLWFGTQGGGASRYDGQSFTSFTTAHGLAHNCVFVIFQDQDGVFWFGTNGGVSRYDGQSFTSFTKAHGLVHDAIRAIYQDRDGHLWFGTKGGGVSRYDGRAFITFTPEDGLADVWVTSILQDKRGHMWFGTGGGGVSRYDGQVFQTVTHRDGLVGNIVSSILEDREDCLWFGSNRGVTRYCCSATAPPSVSIQVVMTNHRYEGTADIEVPATGGLMAFEFLGKSFKTRPEAMAYRYQLEGYESDWKVTHAHRVEYRDLSLGKYAFHIYAVDRDLNYSELATVRLTVVPDPRIQALTEALCEGRMQDEFVGTSEALSRVQMEASQVSRTELTVLILGETGTGKGLVARAIHELSKRKGPFIQVNCGAIPQGLVESELFGHERGAFTGAVSRKLGKVELAQGGTLLLDEIGDLAPEAQVKLLELLEERTFQRVGGIEILLADVRVLAATNRDLVGMVAAGMFRDDLFFRLQAFPIRMPPLRERREDISLLAVYFIERMALHLGKPEPSLSSEALAALYAYDWPGNVRELAQAMQRAVVVCQGQQIRLKDLVLGFAQMDGAVEDIVTLEEHERRYIENVLERTGWMVGGIRGAAAHLGLPESTLRSRMKKLGIEGVRRTRDTA